MSIFGKMTIGFRSILVVNSVKNMTICSASVNFFVMCASHNESDLHPLKGVGNGKIDVFKEFADLLSFAAREKNKQIK